MALTKIGNIINKLKSVEKSLEKYYAVYKICKCGVWFVDIPRTSSSSLKVELGIKYGWPYGKGNLLEKEFASLSYFSDHLKASQIQSILGNKNWEKLFTFTVVRNPWERMVSIYNYRKRKNQIPTDLTFKDYVKLYQEDNSSQLLKHPHLGKNIANMCDYISDEQGRVIVDYIVKYENREQDLQYVREKLNFPNLGKLTLQLASPKDINYQEYYDEESIEIVSSLFARDIKEFKYSFKFKS
jgi:hypothetical protein